MKKLRMLFPTGAVIGMLAVGTAFPAMAAVVDMDTAKFVRGTTCFRHRGYSDRSAWKDPG